jgi:beta-lactamase regulating signal transducer with metallopeptidase domain
VHDGGDARGQGHRPARQAAAYLALGGFALVVLARLVGGHLRLSAIARRAWPADSGDWIAVLDEERRRAGIGRRGRRIRLLVSPDAIAPLTWGVGAPVILLPEEALDWSDAHRRVVLRHELAHVARFDTFWHGVARAALALYWFNPLLWLAVRRLRAESELASSPDERLALLRQARDVARELDLPLEVRELDATLAHSPTLRE